MGACTGFKLGQPSPPSPLVPRLFARVPLLSSGFGDSVISPFHSKLVSCHFYEKEFIRAFKNYKNVFVPKSFLNRLLSLRCLFPSLVFVFLWSVQCIRAPLSGSDLAEAGVQTGGGSRLPLLRKASRGLSPWASLLAQEGVLPAPHRTKRTARPEPSLTQTATSTWRGHLATQDADSLARPEGCPLEV